MEALIEAARCGKEVTVVIELMARFDEETNINWAGRLEQAGAQVVYGVFGLKIHAKLALLLRRETDRRGRVRLVRYAHLGTGNYHPRTTRLYTDFGLLTCDPVVCADVEAVFMHITSLARAERLHRLLLAPFTMHRQVIARIRREIRHARAGKPACIMAKMNALVEEGVIRALYAASQAGVRIDLVVRGACALRPGVPGLSDNIRVRSILGPLSRASPRLVLRQRRRPRRLAVVGRLDGAQPVQADRSGVPGARCRAEAPRRRGGAAALSRRQSRRLGAAGRRAVDQAAHPARRKAEERAVRTAGTARHAAGRVPAGTARDDSGESRRADASPGNIERMEASWT